MLLFSAFLFVISLFCVSAQDNCTKSFLCDEGICKSPCGPTNCKPPDVKDCLGIQLPVYQNDRDICGCCKSSKVCLNYLEEGDDCSKSLVEPEPTKICGPRLFCTPGASGSSTCQKMSTKCMEEARVMEEIGQGMNQALPVCDDSGFYAPMQCQPGGLCRCVDKYTGDPVALGFGISGGLSEAEAEGMDCDCARQYHDSLMTGCRMRLHLADFTDFSTGGEHHEQYLKALEDCFKQAQTRSAMIVSPEDEKHIYFGQGHMRCLHNGNFDLLQCVDRPYMKGMCYCIIKKLDGKYLVNSTSTALEETEELPCFNADIHYHGHYRPCEKIVAEAKQLKTRYAKENVTYIPFDQPPVCTPDGYFSKLQPDPKNLDRVFCSDMEGNMIETFEGNRSTLTGRKMNCECALTRKYLSAGSVRPQCCHNGNFKEIQCISGLCFCVDQYGRQSGPEVDLMEISDLPCQDDSFCCDGSGYQPGHFCHEQL